MRCVRIHIRGYKRLVNTGCNVDDRLVAFVGPNEAGKTSVLRALSWIDAGGTDPLPPGVASRAEHPSSHTDADEIVRATYRLELDDWAAIGLATPPKDHGAYRYFYARHRDGGRVHGLTPRIQRDPRPFAEVGRLLAKAPKALEKALASAQLDFDNGDSDLDLQAAYSTVKKALQSPDSTVSDTETAQLDSFARWLAEAAANEGTSTLGKAAEKLIEVIDILETDHPHSVALSALDQRRPRFRTFTAEDRELSSEYEISDDDIPRPLKRLLDIASTEFSDLQELWADEGARDTHLSDCNEKLNDAFRRAWSQSNLAVALKAEGNLLKVQVKVFEGGRTFYSTFGERSDGLKAFVALVGFLHDLPDATPPILLIDEAETHLHLDAQADLVQLLQDRVQATQVFYTTHSPGCLPPDLGRGLRFVEPEADTGYHTSRISHNFWDSKYPGFSAVLFRMGAAAFAFSAVRNAILAEGPADMILLPTLLRLSSDEDTLHFQIAPRLNDIDESEVRRRDVAANVAYLVDGDKGGRDKKKHLKRRHDVPNELIVTHPPGFAVEDYVQPQQLLQIVNELMDPGISEKIRLEDLPDGETIGRKIDRWFEARDKEGPGKVAIATRLVNSDQPPLLRSGARTRLRKLHAEIETALATRAATER